MNLVIVYAALGVAAMGGPFTPQEFQSRPRTDSAPARAVASAPSPQLVEVETSGILAEYGQDNRLCTAKLVALWKTHEGRFRGPLLQACEKVALGDAAELLDSIMTTVSADSHSPDKNTYAMTFFGDPARILGSKLQDKTTLLDFALETGCWEAILTIDCDPNVKERYLIDGLRTCKQLNFNPNVRSLIIAMSDEAIPKLREIVDDMKGHPEWDGFAIAARTLVEFDDQAVIPYLKAVAGNERLSPDRRDDARLYLAKLQSQHSPDQLLGIVQTERDSRRILKWAVRRLLYLKTDRKRIFDALSGNRRANASGHDIAEETDRYLRSCTGGDPPLSASMDFDTLVFDRHELGSYLRLIRNSKGGEGLRALQQYSMLTLVTSAPSGE